MSLVPWRYDSPYSGPTDERSRPVRRFSCFANGHRLAVRQAFDRPIGPAEGTTGRRLWSAGFLLACLVDRWTSLAPFDVDDCDGEFVDLLSPRRLRGADILELGAGCGLPSLVCACRGARVVATDAADALPHLRHSLDVNCKGEGDGDGENYRDAVAASAAASIEVAALDWAKPDTRLLLQQPPPPQGATPGRRWHAVIGADLLFDAAASAALFDATLTPLMRAQPDVVGAFVYKRRGLAGETVFLDRLAAASGWLEWLQRPLRPMPEFAEPGQHSLLVFRARKDCLVGGGSSEGSSRVGDQ